MLLRANPDFRNFPFWAESSARFVYVSYQHTSQRLGNKSSAIRLISKATFNCRRKSASRCHVHCPMSQQLTYNWDLENEQQISLRHILSGENPAGDDWRPPVRVNYKPFYQNELGEKNTNKPTKILLLTHIKNLFFRRSREGRNRNRCEEICMYQQLLVRLYNRIAQERCYVMLPWDLGNWAKALSKQIYESEGRSQAINTAKSHGDTGG